MEKEDLISFIINEYQPSHLAIERGLAWGKLWDRLALEQLSIDQLSSLKEEVQAAQG